jgi:hypothetical protein
VKTKKFQRTIEDFVCKNCGAFVKGNGYTNHCPECLWSRHVDNNPGDRENHCRGMMEPKEAFLKKGYWCLRQKCQICGKEFIIKTNKDDDFKKIIKLTNKQF